MFSHHKTLSSPHQLDFLERRVIGGGRWQTLCPSWLLPCSCVKKQNSGGENRRSTRTRSCHGFITSKLRSLLVDDMSSRCGALFFVEPGCGRPCPHDAVKVSHQLCTFCVVNQSKHKISPCYFCTLSIDASAMGSWRWMICNASFGSRIAMDFSGCHGRSIFLLWREEMRREDRVRDW